MADLEDLFQKELGFSPSDIEKLSTSQAAARKALGVPLAILDAEPTMGSVIVSSMIQNPLSGSNTGFAERLVDQMSAQAERDEHDFRVLVESIVQLSEERKALPVNLAYFARDFLLGKRNRSRRPGRPTTEARDKVIANAVEDVLKAAPDLRATRNPSSDHSSACSVVAEELANLSKRSKIYPALGEAAVVKIWRRLK